MSLESWAYTTSVADVQARVGDITANSRVFSSTTTPTLVQAQEYVNQAAAELNMLLQANRYTAPVSASADPYAHRMLRAAVADGAAARILAALPADSFAYNVGEEEGRGRGLYYQQSFQHVLKLIRDGRFEAARSRSIGGGMMVGSKETRAGVDKEPFFKRGQFDISGTRSLTATTT